MQFILNINKFQQYHQFYKCALKMRFGEYQRKSQHIVGKYSEFIFFVFDIFILATKRLKLDLGGFNFTLKNEN